MQTPADPNSQTIRVFRRFLAGRTVAVGQTDEDTVNSAFADLAERLISVSERSTGGNGDGAKAHLGLLRDETDLFAANPVAYLDLLRQSIDIAPSAPEPPAETAPTMATPVEAPTSPILTTTAATAAATASARSGFGMLPWLAAIAAAATVWLFGLGGFSCGVIRKVCFDSGWVEIDNTSTREWSFPHGLSGTPARVEILFWPPGDEERWFPVAIDVDTSGNPINVELTPTNVILHVYSGSAVRSVFSARSGRWQSYAKGRFRILANVN
jgi:hypothetical protein